MFDFIFDPRKRTKLILYLVLGTVIFACIVCVSIPVVMIAGTSEGNSVLSLREISSIGTPIAFTLNTGTPPRSGNCKDVGKVYDDVPFRGWPLDFYQCDWSIVSAYFCSPNYYKSMGGHQHWGIDFARKINDDGTSQVINGAPVLATAYARVVQAAYSDPPGFNYGMGNFVRIQALSPTCERDVGIDIDGNGVIDPAACYEICERDANADFNGDGQIGDFCGEELPWKAVYMHLQDVTVQPGQIVRRGDVIGHVDNTGNSTGPHLHYQIEGPMGAIDPAPTLGCGGYDWQKGVDQGR